MQRARARAPDSGSVLGGQGKPFRQGILEPTLRRGQSGGQPGSRWELRSWVDSP